jgi:hypothetical protein
MSRGIRSGEVDMPAPAIGAVVNGYKFGGGDPNKQTSWVPVTGDEYLSSLPPDRAMFAKNMAEGKIPYPGSFALKSPQWLGIIKDAQHYDPTFDATLWPARVKMRVDANSGKIGQNVNAINTAIQHAGVDFEKSKDVAGYGGFPLAQTVNWVVNKYKESSGDPGVTNYDNAMAALAHELRRVYAQTGAGSQADLDKFEKNLSPNMSDEQKRGAIKTQMQLLVGKINSVRDQYKNAMGPTSAPLQILHPETIVALKSLGFSPEDLGLSPDEFEAAPSSPTQPPSAFGMKAAPTAPKRKFVIEKVGP